MKNWSTDTALLKKDKEAYEIWSLQQHINYGLDGECLSRKKLIKYWDKLEIDPDAKKFLSFVLWPKKKAS